MHVGTCPDCDEIVVTCDNGVRLSHPAEPRPANWRDDPEGPYWAIMNVGPLSLASVPSDLDAPARGHRLHEHQPKE